MLNINERDKGACVVQLEKTGKPLVEHTAYLDPDSRPHPDSGRNSQALLPKRGSTAMPE